MTTDDVIYGLKHVAEDHPCCAVFIGAAVRLIQRQSWRLLQPNCMWLNRYGGCRQRSGNGETIANLYGRCEKRSCPVLKQDGRNYDAPKETP